MDSGFILLMALTVAFAAFAAWRGYEQDKRENPDNPGRTTKMPHESCVSGESHD